MKIHPLGAISVDKRVTFLMHVRKGNPNNNKQGRFTEPKVRNHMKKTHQDRNKIRDPLHLRPRCTCLYKKMSAQKAALHKGIKDTMNLPLQTLINNSLMIS